jgi:hypothetical protein
MKSNLLFPLTFSLCMLLSCQPFVVSPTPANTTPATQTPMSQPTAAMPPTLVFTAPAVPTSSTLLVVTDVTNTHWVGSIYDQNDNRIWEVFEIIFLPGGKLRYYTPNEWRENGTWQQKGNDITLEWGNHACDLYGVLSGDAILGARKCTDGKTWGWSVQYKAP